MSTFMSFLMFGFGLSSIVTLIWMLVRVIKKRPFKKQGLYCLSFFIATIIAAIVMTASMTPEEKAALAEQQAKKQAIELAEADQQAKTQAIELAEKETSEKAALEKALTKKESSEKSTVIIQEQPIKENNIAKDDLQKLYLKISNTMTYNEILKIAKNSNLPFAEHKYSDSQRIKIVFDKKVLPDKYAPSGDYLVIAFNKNKDKINFIEYNNHQTFKTLVEFLDGYYWDLHGKKDAGLYGYIPGENKNIFASKEDQLNFVNIMN